ncbi:DNA topoisomerase I [Methanobrevibacter sp. 87.7]|uniref:DNA topoisomerase I n=1 Tax=Methanobrevibacter sp. 87.7 TaxID=387957 RepID=UPI000B50D1D8|nr:DNA topoisomerase I [Methanobrevibacter sp. 87.7]OWT33382.1 DNA topoisomerase I [Methanobrevibacter sp. 87.7]
MNELIICEKPKAAEKIANAISPNAKKHKYNKKANYWEIDEGDKHITVVSAVGHLYSLTPKNSRDNLYFDLEWAPLYEIDKTKKYTRDYVNLIKKFSKNVDSYIHACDFDIEGTLIGYNALKYACGKKDLKNVSRMKFSTLTKTDILDAYNNRIDLDVPQAESGIARHILDFYFGVNISKTLMQAVRKSKHRYLKLSAGRVQTPTLSILVDREKQIKKFVPEPYWLIKAVINDEIVADHVEGKIFDKKRAENIYKNCKGSDATVKSVKINKTIRKPPVPFNLGGLQSAAYSAFGFSPKKTQTIAQNLYTGGYTSYPRTSSQKLPKSLNYKNILIHLSANPEFKKHIVDLPKELKPREGKKKDAAHPAIHPTGVIPEKLDKDERKVYELIVYRFISVFSEDSELETMKVNLNIAKEEFEFKRKRVSKMGWLAHYPFKKVEADSFPDLKKGDLVRIKDITSEEKETKPPARYNEASLIKELEKRELGTKATRADIIAKLYDRKYISGKKIEVNQLGENMIDTLQEYCKDIISEELTRNFEKDLEKIQENKRTKEEVVDNAHKEVVEIIKDIHKNEDEIGSKLYSAYMKSQIVGKCACGGDLIKRYSPKTKAHFVGCSNYPDCKVIYNLPKGANFLKQKCPKCGLPIISFGKPRQHACLDPNCGKENVKKQKPLEIVGKCPDCGKDLVKRNGRYGEFIGCRGFPKCRFTCSVDDLEKILNKSTESDKAKN